MGADVHDPSTQEPMQTPLLRRPQPASTGPSAAVAPTSRRPLFLGSIAFGVVTVLALTWAKWYPYWLKLFTVAATHSVGSSIVTGKAAAPPAPSWSAAIGYALDYGRSIWIALVAGLLIAAAVEAFLPKRMLLTMFRHHRGPAAGTLAGGLLAMPSMMCTCCAAPVAVSIRRQGVSVASASAYWVGNPTVNPATLAFMAIVLPWQFVTVRLITGIALVFAVTVLVGRWSGVRCLEPDAMRPTPADHRDDPSGTPSVTRAGRRFVAALARLSATLLPEYLAVVLVLGGLRGWLFPLSHGVATWGIFAILLFAVVGTLFMIPTAAEIPIIQGLLAAGVGLGAAGALLVTLPALSLPSMVMVWRSFPRRAIVAMAGSVAAMGVIGAGLLVLLS